MLYINKTQYVYRKVQKSRPKDMEIAEKQNRVKITKQSKTESVMQSLPMPIFKIKSNPGLHTPVFFPPLSLLTDAIHLQTICM